MAEVSEREAFLESVRSRPGVVVTGPRALILEVLWDQGGVVRSEEGSATLLLQRQVEAAGGNVGPKALVNALRTMEDKGLIVRDVRGKKTYAIGLPGGEGVAVAPAADLTGLAQALLERVGQILAAGEQAEGPSADELEEAEARIRVLEAENAALRERLDLVERESGALVATGAKPVSAKSRGAIDRFVRRRT